MKDIRKFTLAQLTELLEALETDGVAYLQVAMTTSIALDALNVVEPYLLAQTVPEAETEPKTMFPARLATEPEMPPRKTLQFFARPELHAAVAVPPDLYEECEAVESLVGTIVLGLIDVVAARYGFDGALLAHLLCKEEWALNAVQYVSLPGREGQKSFPTHRDWGLFTLYPAIGADGLEVELDGEFVNVPPTTDGCMLVYAGAVMRKLTGGRIKAARHHVRQKSDAHRTVLLYYVDPPRDLPLPEGRTVGEYMDEQLRKIRQI